MKKIRIFFLIAFIHITLINAQVNLSISSTNGSAGDTINLEISIDNPNTTLGGFQFIINDTPNQLDLLNVVATERTDHMMVNFDASTNVVIAFDLTGLGFIISDCLFIPFSTSLLSTFSFDLIFNLFHDLAVFK